MDFSFVKDKEVSFHFREEVSLYSLRDGWRQGLRFGRGCYSNPGFFVPYP